MAKIGANGIKEKEEVKVKDEPCFGGYLEDDPACQECDKQEGCQEKAKELLDKLSAVSEKNSEEEEATKDEFDPKEIILSGEDRIDVLCDMTKEQLIAIAKHNDLDIGHIDVKKKDIENDLILEIDSQMAEKEDDKQYEEGEGDESGTEPVVVMDEDGVEVETLESEDDSGVEPEDIDDIVVTDVEEKEKVEVSEELEEEEVDLESEEISVPVVEDLGSSKESRDEVQSGLGGIGVGMSKFILDSVTVQKSFLSEFGDAGLLKEVRNELNTIISDLLGSEEKTAQVVVQEQVEVVSREKVEPSKPEPELKSIEKGTESVVNGSTGGIKKKVVEKVESKGIEGIPDCVIDIADNAGFTVKVKKTGFAVKDGGKNVLTGLNTKDGVMIIFNKGDVAKLEGSEAVAKPPWAPYPFVWADNPSLSSLIITHFGKE